jgi:hypothetical protein
MKEMKMTNFEIRYRLLSYQEEPYKNNYGIVDYQNVDAEYKDTLGSPFDGYYWEEFLFLTEEVENGQF